MEQDTSSIAIVLTARMNSERLPGKALADVAGKPLVEWIIERLRPVGTVILATAEDHNDYQLLDLAVRVGIPFVTTPQDDVVTKMNNAVEQHCPNAKYVLRAMGDCPFIAPEHILRAVQCMERYSKEAFAWALAPYSWPVYGAREFPYARKAWDRLNKLSTERQHVDMHFHNNRALYKVLYHEPPASVYFRPYRLEVDWPEDLEMVRRVADGISMLSPIANVVRYLDAHEDIAAINRERVERTGPTRYSRDTQRTWIRQMQGQPIATWHGNMWYPPSSKSEPVFCGSGQCFMGFAERGVLHTQHGMIEGRARLLCECGQGKDWNAPIRSK